ncbi:sulfite exporter TauE/SafE family protein [Prosthecobacter sp.]|uniref:sulfite exporter TauE/SafE family protein n=1 Tax=Prosthecobacter sp. TaxID=1965333 RepID=UPI0037844A31
MMQVDTSAAAFVAGMVTSVHCVGMCGPLSCSWAISGKGGGFMRSTAMYHGGRLISYGVAGAIAGMVGAVPLAFFQHGAGIVLPWMLVLAFACVGLGLDKWLPKPKFLAAGLRRVQTAAFRMKSTLRAGLLGLATPLLPCGPLYMMLALATANGSAAKGAGFAVAFGLGTLPLLFLAQTQLHLLGGKLQPDTMRKVQRGLALVTAVVLAWRLRDTLDFGSSEAASCCHAMN